ncbi:MAG: ATP-binding protein [Polyangiaceae bacterium]
MTLAQRLMLAIAVLTIAVTAAVGLGVREAWRSTEEERFREQFKEAVSRLNEQLSTDITSLPEMVEPICRHDPTLDSTLIDLSTGRLDSGRRLAASLRVPDMRKALRVDELVLITSEGEILGAVHPNLVVGATDQKLASRIAKPSQAAGVRGGKGEPLAVEAHCTRRLGKVWIGVYAARHLDRLLEDVGRSHGVQLRVASGSKVPSDLMVERLQVDELGGITLIATKSRVPLLEALKHLDGTILAIGGVTLGVALLLSMLMARGLARPIADLSEQARAVVVGNPQPVRGRGGRELRELADSFNKAILDLAALRKRLAATERIAARREIARQVAHEIKNPLAPIRAAVETLRRLRARNDEAFDEYFDEATRTVLDEVRRINTIVSEFTRFARLPAPNPAPLNLVESIRKVVMLHENTGAKVSFGFEPCPEVQADADQMVQVVTNLVQNAIDACREVPSPEVRVSLKPLDSTEIELRVADNGPGIPPDIQARLFEPYVTTKPHGTGLGLAIVQRIVVEHGGDISYEDRSGGGACFRVTLPVGGPPLLSEAPPSTRDFKG